MEHVVGYPLLGGLDEVDGKPVLRREPGAGSKHKHTNNPMNQLKQKQDGGQNQFNNNFSDILTWIGEFRPGNKTIWVVFDEESDFLGPRM